MTITFSLVTKHLAKGHGEKQENKSFTFKAEVCNSIRRTFEGLVRGFRSLLMSDSMCFGFCGPPPEALGTHLMLKGADADGQPPVGSRRQRRTDVLECFVGFRNIVNALRLCLHVGQCCRWNVACVYQLEQSIAFKRRRHGARRQRSPPFDKSGRRIASR